MADILLDLPIRAPLDRVFAAVSTPTGLDTWWTKQCSTDEPREGAEYALGFGPGYDWCGKVTRFMPHSEFAIELVRADADWTGTIMRVQLEARATDTWVRFAHLGWPSANEHFRISTNCWASYLRILRRSLEHGESVPYEERLDV